MPAPTRARLGPKRTAGTHKLGWLLSPLRRLPQPESVHLGPSGTSEGPMRVAVTPLSPRAHLGRYLPPRSCGRALRAGPAHTHLGTGRVGECRSGLARPAPSQRRGSPCVLTRKPSVTIRFEMRSHTCGRGAGRSRSGGGRAWPAAAARGRAARLCGTEAGQRVLLFESELGEPGLGQLALGQPAAVVAQQVEDRLHLRRPTRVGALLGRPNTTRQLRTSA